MTKWHVAVWTQATGDDAVFVSVNGSSSWAHGVPTWVHLIDLPKLKVSYREGTLVISWTE